MTGRTEQEIRADLAEAERLIPEGDWNIPLSRRLVADVEPLLDRLTAAEAESERIKSDRAAAYRSIHAAQLHAYDLLHESGADRIPTDEGRTPEQTALVVLYSLVHDAVKLLQGRTDIEYPDLQKVTELAGELRVEWAKTRKELARLRAVVAAVEQVRIGVMLNVEAGQQVSGQGILELLDAALGAAVTPTGQEETSPDLLRTIPQATLTSGGDEHGDIPRRERAEGDTEQREGSQAERDDKAVSGVRAEVGAGSVQRRSDVRHGLPLVRRREDDDAGLAPTGPTYFHRRGTRGVETLPAAVTPTETVHSVPPVGSGLMPCCNRTPFDLPASDRMTADASLVTCQGVTPTPEATTEERIESIEGVTRWMRSKQDTSRASCTCCGGGPHVFAKGVTLDEPPEGFSHFMRDRHDVVGWLHRSIGRMPEGARIRISVAAVTPTSVLASLRCRFCGEPVVPSGDGWAHIAIPGFARRLHCEDGKHTAAVTPTPEATTEATNGDD